MAEVLNAAEYMAALEKCASWGGGREALIFMSSNVHQLF